MLCAWNVCVREASAPVEAEGASFICRPDVSFKDCANRRARSGEAAAAAQGRALPSAIALRTCSLTCACRRALQPEGERSKLPRDVRADETITDSGTRLW